MEDDYGNVQSETINEYSTIEEKDLYFSTNKCIETIDDLNKTWSQFESFYSKKNLIFRGCTHAKYQLYSSGHREWVKSGESDSINFTDWIQYRINEYRQWNQATIPRFLKSLGISESNDIALLAYAQHQGLPTPLIDFTWNPFIALYFAIQQHPEHKRSIEKIDDYCSIYFVNPQWHVLSGSKTLLEQLIAKHGSREYRTVNIVPYFAIAESSDAFKTMNNMRILNQEGVFFCYNNYGCSFEAKFKFDTDFAEATGRLPKSSNGYNLCACYNFHVDLYPIILDRLGKMGIYWDYLFPDFNRLKERSDMEDFSFNQRKWVPYIAKVKPKPSKGFSPLTNGRLNWKPNHT